MENTYLDKKLLQSVIAPLNHKVGLQNVIRKALDSIETKMTASAVCFVDKKSRCLKANLYEEENSLMQLIYFM